MNNSATDFSPEEQRVLALYRDPRNAGLRRAIRLSIQYAIAAGVFAALAIATKNPLWSLAVLGVFVVSMIARLAQAKKIAGVMPRIIQKYEHRIAQLEAIAARPDDPPAPK